MALLARTVLDEARDHHVAFHPDQVPNKVLLRHLSRTERALAQKIVPLDEGLLARTRTVGSAELAAALASGTGLGVGEVLLVLDVAVVETDGRVRPGWIVPTRTQNEGRHPAVYLQGGRVFPVDLRLRGHSASGWDAIESLTLRYVPLPPALTYLDQELVLPEVAQSAVVDELVLFMARREGVLRDLPGVVERASASAAGLLDTVSDQRSVTTWRVRKV